MFMTSSVESLLIERLGSIEYFLAIHGVFCFDLFTQMVERALTALIDNNRDDEMCSVQYRRVFQFCKWQWNHCFKNEKEK